jgi:hypothetical protein
VVKTIESGKCGKGRWDVVEVQSDGEEGRSTVELKGNAAVDGRKKTKRSEY